MRKPHLPDMMIPSKRSGGISAAPARARYLASFEITSRMDVGEKYEKAKHLLAVASMIVSWYVVSLLLTAANKILLDSLAFPYPLIVTFIHFSGVALITRLIALVLVPPAHLTVSRKRYVTTILPSRISPPPTIHPATPLVAFLSAVEVAFSNQAYSMVSLSVMTVMKSTIVAATYATSIFAGLERFDLRLALVLGWIIFSVAAAVPGMEIHNQFGVVVLIVAVTCGAIRWVLVHKELQGVNSGSLNLIALSQPLAALCLLPAAVVYDLPDMIGGYEKVCAIVLLLSVAVLFACVLLFCEFRLIELTSSLSLTVAGVGKECLTIAMSTLLFNEHLQAKAIFGLASSIAGITMYSYLRSQIREGGLISAADLEAAEPTSRFTKDDWRG